MLKKIIYILFYFGLICNLWSETISPGNAKINSIDLNIYDGTKSLLLNWIFPDTIQSKETKIFRKSGSDGEYELVANFLESKSENNKYLDDSCKNSIRYFYYVEIVDGLSDSGVGALQNRVGTLFNDNIL